MKTSTINLSISKDLLAQADKLAKRESRSRSELMRAALRIYLERRSRWDKIFERTDAHVRRLGLKPEDVEEAIREARRT
jgi:metal-responsive CopG/Arc/MetJ family transcriptional regulator